mmetsp:Transcript_14952/g.17914  ORF Transcript_14952/g.17914 Transcript_14952/m.17914 type:complete len:257 (+) Transcript_14952:167-937(+)
MVSRGALESNFPRFVCSFEAEEILGVPFSLLHGKNFLPSPILKVSPPFPFIWEHHCIAHSLHHNEFVCFPEVFIVSGISCQSLVIPICEFRIFLKRLALYPCWIPEIINLKEHILRDRVVCSISTRRSNCFANDVLAGVTLRKSCHSRNSSVNMNDGIDGRIIVLLDVSSKNAVSLTESECIEPICKFGVGTDFFCKNLNVLVHGHEKAMDCIRRLVVARWNARGVYSCMFSGVCSDPFHSRIETGISHPVREDKG